MTYFFPLQKATVENPTLKKITASYSLELNTVTVTAILYGDGYNIGFIELGEMENTDSWNDEDVMKFAVEQLESFKVVEESKKS